PPTGDAFEDLRRPRHEFPAHRLAQCGTRPGGRPGRSGLRTVRKHVAIARRICQSPRVVLNMNRQMSLVVAGGRVFVTDTETEKPKAWERVRCFDEKTPWKRRAIWCVS